MCLPCWKFTAATFVGVVFVGRLNFCGLNGLPVAVALPVAVVFPAVVAVPASAGLPAPVGLPFPAALPTSAGWPAPGGLPLPFPVGLPAPVGFPPGFETCPACAPFLCSFFFPSCAPGARDASAILQITTRNILISFFLLRY